VEAKSEAMTIGALASAAGVNVESIRFYQRKALLAEPVRPYGKIRRYDARDLARVRFIKSAQRIGFTLDEIAQLLQLEDGTHCSQARDIALRRLTDIRRRMADLQRIELALFQLVERCGAGQGKVTCPLIASLQREA
jgi:MerR family transcriptional regulator, mercuric resistance operon regulatory protein